MANVPQTAEPNAEIPAERPRPRLHREILERDGEPPLQVYREFAEYAGNLPLVAFNLEYDLDEVLKPEWKRLRIAAIVFAGCALCGSPSVCLIPCRR